MTIYNGDDPNISLPNASSINPLITYGFHQVYGKMDGNGVVVDTMGIMLPEGFRDIEVWRDFADSVDEVMNSEIATQIESLMSTNDPYASSVNPAIDRRTLLYLIGAIGFKYKQNDVFDIDDLKRFVRHTPQFWGEKGNRFFIQYMSYVVNAQLQMQYLWTQDYKVFVPEGSPLIGRPVWESAVNATANVVPFGTGDGAQTVFPLMVMNSTIDSVSGTPTIYRVDWAGQTRLYNTPRTNRIRRSVEIGSSAWYNDNPTNLIVQTTSASAPDGSATASVLKPMTTGANAGSLLDGSAVTPGPVTCSVYQSSEGLTAGQKVRYALWSVDSSNVISLVGQTDLEWTGTQMRVAAYSGLASSVLQSLGDGWYRIEYTGTTGVGARLSIQPGLTHTNPVTVWGAQLEQGSSATRLIKTYGVEVTTTDFAFTNNNRSITLSSPLPVGASLSWSGTYNQAGTWYPTSHVYIVYDVDKFRGSVSNNFNSQDSLAAFFYTIAPIELVIQSFVLNVNFDPTVLQLAGDVQISVYTPMEVEAITPMNTRA